MGGNTIEQDIESLSADRQVDKQPDDWQEQLAKLVMDEWNNGRSYVDDLNLLYEDIYQMLRGKRPIKTYDWQSNVVVNKVFQIVWTAVPYISQKIFGATPIIGIKGYDKKQAWAREEILEFWNTLNSESPEHIPYFLIIVMLLLRALLNGVGIMKKGWHHVLKVDQKTITIDIPQSLNPETGEIAESEPFTRTIKIETPIEDWPDNHVVNNRNIVGDWLLEPGQSIRAGRFIIHREMMDLDSLYSADIKYMNLEKISPDNSSAQSSERQDKSKLTGIDGQETTPESNVYTDIEIYERQGVFPVYKKKKDGKWIPCFDKEDIYSKDDVKMQHMIATVAKSGETSILIRFDKNPYKELTYIDLHIYLDAERWNSIGMVEPIKDLQVALNDNLNASFDEIWQNLMPPVVVNKFAMWDWDTMQYATGQRWLVGGPPADSIYFKEPGNITADSWRKHGLIDNEIQLTSSITPPMQGLGKEKAATTNVMNAQMSAGKLDFIVKMVEITTLIPSAQMDIRFAKKFAHPKTLETILGKPFTFSDWEEVYKYLPAASSVKLEYQRNQEILQDIQLISVLASVNNPNTAKVINVLWGNILRNRDMPKEAAMFDEEYFSPDSPTGAMQMLQRGMGAGEAPASNEKGLPMSGEEEQMRRLTYMPGGM